MSLPEIDYQSLTDDEVAQLKAEASLEQDRRIRVAQAPIKAEELAVEYLKDVGRDHGSDWVQPTGAHDAYPLGYQVVHNQIVWESLIPANTTTPGSDPRWWKDLTTVEDPNVWSPNAKTYVVGDIVTFNGKSYECLQAHTSQAGWEPNVVPALWKDLDTPVEPPPVEPPSASVWDSNGINYVVGNRVSYGDFTYICLQNHTSQPGWTPEAVPALWDLEEA